MTKSIITINGRSYDAITGKPLAASTAAHTVQRAPQHAARAQAAPQKPVRAMTDVAPVRTPRANHAPAQAIHQTTQKSQTLYRKALKKPTPVQHAAQAQPVRSDVATPAHHAAPKPAEVKAAVHERSPLISKFGAHQQHVQIAQKPVEQPKKVDHIAPATTHPAVAKALQQHAPQPQKQLSGSDLKEQLIKERLAEVSDKPRNRDHKKAGWLSRQPRLVTVLSSTLALLILGGYLTYITLPSISLRVAASRAGVNANMPEYKPDGYSLDGPITYSPGEVVISYKSNSDNDAGYKLVQKATNWDSQAVLDNYVAKLTDNYLTFQERGVTVYTFGSKAAWVNGGLLYTIEGNAALSSEQILRVATSI